MRYHCNECSCEFYYSVSFTFEEVKCPQCESNHTSSMDGITDATQ